MIKILKILLSSFLLNLQISAQYITYTPESNKFNFSSPNALPLYVPSETPGDQTACNAYTIEYGNGSFSINPPNGIIYNYNDPNKNYVSFLSFFPRYDTIKPPAIIQYKIPLGAIKGVPSDNPKILLDSENLRVSTIPSTMRPGGTNLFIITYNLPKKYSNGKIIFYYNEKDFSFLNPVDKNSNVENTSVKSIRTGYFGETIDDRRNAVDDALGQQNTLKNSMKGKDYQNVLIFNVNNSVKGEKNIFITLESKDKLPHSKAGIFEAFLIPTEDSVNIINDTIPNIVDDTLSQDVSLDDLVMSSFVEIGASFRPYDPNFIEVFPKCILKGNGKTKVHYHVHCQNDGAGKNYELSVNILMNPKLLAGINTSTLRIKASGDVVHPKDFSYKLTDSSLNVLITLNDMTSKRKVGASLMDNTIPAAYCSPETMADIDFEVEVDNRIETDLDASASIIFHDSEGVAMAPVKTEIEWLVVREKCNEYITPYPEPDPQCIFWGLCCWWWIIILVVVFVLFWVILRRRRNRQMYDQT